MKNERKPKTTDSEEANDSSNDESATPEYSSDNSESRKKRESKRIKTKK